MRSQTICGALCSSISTAKRWNRMAKSQVEVPSGEGRHEAPRSPRATIMIKVPYVRGNDKLPLCEYTH